MGQHPDSPSDLRRVIIKWSIQSILGIAGYGLILFASAGTLAWSWGWALLAVIAASLAGQVLILVPINPDLLVERSRGVRAEGVKRWDKWLTPFAAGILPMVCWILAGLDYRYGWSGPQPSWLHLSGLLGVLLGFGLFLWAMACNAFFSEGVRIQHERGHTVATSGPYRCVRHPGYSGAILYFLGTPFLLGSIWALIPAVLGSALYGARTFLEDKTLIEELPGYREYTRSTRYRLIPGVW